MAILAISFGLAFVGFHLYTAWQRYMAQEALIISLGLVGLGGLNFLGGAIVTMSEIAFGPSIVGIGLLSMIIGSFLDAYAYKDTIEIEPYAIQIGIFVFIVGLFALL